MRNVFAVPEEGTPLQAASESDASSPPPPPPTVPQLDDDYVDALGDPIRGHILHATGIVVKRSEEVWGVEAARVAQSRIAQARRFREWALE